MNIYIYIGLRWPPAATYNCAQVHHRSPAGTFTRVPGRCLRWSPTPPGPRWPPAKLEILHLFRWYTHTPRHSGADEMKMKMKWKWKWNESYLTRTRRGERKRRGKEKHQHNTPSPKRAKPWKGKEKEKRRPTDTQPDQRRRGRTEAPEPTWQSET